MSFDKLKLKSLNHYIRESHGHSVKLPDMQKRLLRFGKYLEEHDKGSVPFLYGGTTPDHSVFMKVNKSIQFNKTSQFTTIFEDQKKSI